MKSTLLFIARRLSLSSDSKSGKSGVVIGTAGVTLAIVIMILAIAVVSGFKQEITGKLKGFNADVTIHAQTQPDNPAFTAGIRLSDSLAHIISQTAPLTSANLIIRQPAIFKTDSDFQGIILKGLPSGKSWDFVAANLTQGQIPGSSPGSVNTVVISSTTASQLGLKPGDDVLTHFLDDNSLRTRKLHITGIYDTHFHDFDATLAFTPLAMLQKLAKADSLTGTAVELRLTDSDVHAADAVAQALADRFISATVDRPANPMLYRTESIRESCAMYLNWLDLLDTNVVVIIVLMACVSGFTLISSLFIIILSRVGTIGLLKAIGATNLQIRRTFIYMAQRLVFRGMLLGNAIAITLILIQNRWHILHLDPDNYYLSFVPAQLSWIGILSVNIGVLIISALILILPSHIIAGISPAKSLRFE